MYCFNVSKLPNMAYNILETIPVPFRPDIFRSKICKTWPKIYVTMKEEKSLLINYIDSVVISHRKLCILRRFGILDCYLQVVWVFLLLLFLICDSCCFASIMP